MSASNQFPSPEPGPPVGSPALDSNPPSFDDAGQYISFDLRKVLISAFLAWQIFAVSVWLLPDQGVRLGLNKLVTYYMLSTGVWQQWTMFSPHPARTNFYIDARIEYADGGFRLWHFPRVRDMGSTERYQRERYRKMMEYVYVDSGSRLWWDLARYAALENDRRGDPKAYPLTVHLIRHVQDIPDYPAPIQPPVTKEFYEYTFEASPAAKLGKHE